MRDIHYRWKSFYAPLVSPYWRTQDDVLEVLISWTGKPKVNMYEAFEEAISASNELDVSTVIPEEFFNKVKPHRFKQQVWVNDEKLSNIYYGVVQWRRFYKIAG